MTDKQRFASVWDAIEDTPQNAASMRALGLDDAPGRGHPPARHDASRSRRPVWRDPAAHIRPDAGQGQPVSLDTLIDMAATAGMVPTVKVSKPKTAPVKLPTHRATAHA